MGVKSGSKADIFAKKLRTFAHFLSIYVHFYRIFLAHFTQTPQANTPTSIFGLKTTISPQITSKISAKNTIFLKNPPQKML
ncbi:MAG: hypothetical protein ACE5NM_13240 [Sedimentisphaerales bacterium]